MIPWALLVVTLPPVGVEKIDLGGAWRVSQAERKIDLPARVPGSVHTDLLAAGAIPDPFYRDNERNVQWVGEVPWTYTRRFIVPTSYLSHQHVLLRCEGLDTLATIRLNGREVAKTGNLFRTWEFDAAPFLRAGDNDIEIAFAPVGPVLMAKENQAAFPGKPAWGQGYVRKTPVQNGWDFAPKLLTCGIPRPIGLVAWNEARLTQVAVRQRHLAGKVDLDVSVEAQTEGTVVAESILSLGGKVVARSHCPLPKAGTMRLVVPKPQLWWPAGMGAQPLYELRTLLRGGTGRLLDERTEKIGLRTVRWTPKTAEHPLSVAVNGSPFFVKGANWIPPDALNARVKADDYRRWVQLAKAANMNMLRFWGGGLYEDDALYEACDKAGILVWFEFKFACTPYPAFDPAWVADVREEARDNVRRLRNHPSIAIWSGNNEVGGFVGETTSLFKMSREDYARLFHRILADVVQDLVPDAQYTPGSPESGDEHNWAVWHGGAPFETYRDDHGFMSEFGFQSFPEPRTIGAVTAPSDRNSVLSPVLKFRQRNIGGHGNENIADTIERYFRKPKDFESTLWASQILQAQGILTGVEHWRRDWPRSTGSLIWQFDDDWPTASWSMIDYYGRPKALYYRVKDAYAPVMLSGFVDDRSGAEWWVANDRKLPFQGKMDLVVTRANGVILAKKSFPASAPAGTSTVFAARFDAQPLLATTGRNDLFLWANLTENGRVVSRSLLTLVQPKNLRLADPAVRASVATLPGGYAVTLSATRPALWTWIEAPESSYEDNFVHLRPGELRTIVVHSKAPLEQMVKSLRIRSLYDTYDSTVPLPDLTVVPLADGSIDADANHAELLGGLVLEKGAVANIGNWSRVQDWPEWRVAGSKAGRYRVSITLASPEGGSRFSVAIAGRRFPAVVPKTGSWTSYQTIDLGSIELMGGKPIRVVVRAHEKNGSHVMNLRSIRLSKAPLPE